MGMYKFKEFLDFDDVIDYFRDFKVYNAPLEYSEHARNRIKGMLLELIKNGKLTPVFYYDGVVREGFELDSTCCHIKAWICVNEYIIKELFFDNELGIKTIDLNINDYLRVYKAGIDMTYDINFQELIDEMGGFIFMDTNRYKIELEKPEFFDEDNPLQGFKTQTERRMDILFDILDDMKLKAEQDQNINISFDDYKDRLPKKIKNEIWLTFNDLLYPKSELDVIFNSNQTIATEITTLQAQLTQAHGEIDRLKAELEQAQALLAEKQNIESVKDTKPKSYITPELQIIDDVIAEFWGNYTDDKIPVKKDIIVNWIVEKYSISNNIARAIDTILRPEKARTGGLKALSARPKN